VDSDCDGSLVDEFADTDGDLTPDCIDPDDDNDGHADAADCAPLDAAIFPGAPESCDLVDSDCDGSLVDEFVNTDGDRLPDCVDTDDDGDGDPDATDCAPLDATVHHDAVEQCNGRDDDCDAAIDEGFGVGRSCTAGVGSCANVGTVRCTSPTTSACDVTGKPAGTSCQDGVACTHGDECSGGAASTCVGTPYTCPSPCTSCDGAGGCTQAAGTCLIGGSCYADGAVDPGDPCRVCDAAAAPTAWSAAVDGTACGSGLECWGGACLDPDLFQDSALVDPVQGVRINTWAGLSGQRWVPCYKASVHGRSAAAFHARCDYRGPTVMVAKLNPGMSTERLIGGYAVTSWQGSGYTGNSTNFLFSLTNAYKHYWHRYGYYQYNHPLYGPTWGGGHDFYTDLASSSYCNIGHDYLCRVGSYGSSTCRNDFCGTYNPVLGEVEVFVKEGAGCGAGRCDIDGVCYPNGTVNPSNPCQACVVATSATAWSPVADGTTCGAGLNCQAGACVPAAAFLESTLLTLAQGERINEWVGQPGQVWRLCYRRSRDGASASAFHSGCDSKGATVMVARLNGGASTERLIGGYAAVQWDGSGYTGNSTNFLFSLTNDFKHSWFRYGNYQYNNPNYGPTWGGGHDFYTNLASSSYCNIGYDYVCRTGSYGSSTCRNDFCGTYNPALTEVEVFYRVN
jgi:hypothetical protein